MAKEDLIPLKKGEQRAKDLGRKGGLSKSKAKSIGASRRHALERCKTEEQKEVVRAIYDGRFDEALKTVFAKQIIEIDDMNVKDANGVVRNMISMMPAKSINLHGIDGEIRIKWEREKDED